MERGTGTLGPAQQAVVAGADTFFIASSSGPAPSSNDSSGSSAAGQGSLPAVAAAFGHDLSHRGGPPGFVQASGFGLAGMQQPQLTIQACCGLDRKAWPPWLNQKQVTAGCCCSSAGLPLSMRRQLLPLLAAECRLRSRGGCCAGATTRATSCSTRWVRCLCHIMDRDVDGAGARWLRLALGAAACFVSQGGMFSIIPTQSHNPPAGNLLVNPACALLFLDFSSGDVLMAAGDAEVLHRDRELPGAHVSCTSRL